VVVGGNADILGPVGRDAVDVGGYLHLGPKASVGRDLTAVGLRLADPAVSGDMARLATALDEQERLLHAFDRAGGARLRNRAEGLLRDLGIPRDHWDLPQSALSGGQRKLVGLATCLIGDPDLLLLDEPDNHLDLQRKETLERLLAEFDGAVVIVSHDRYLLDDTVERIAELEPAAGGARLKVWEGNYSAYVVQKEIALRRQQQDYASQQKEIARLEAAVKRFELWARLVVDERHIKQARNKQRQIDRMDKARAAGAGAAPDGPDLPATHPRGRDRDAARTRVVRVRRPAGDPRCRRRDPERRARRDHRAQRLGQDRAALAHGR